MAYKKSFIVLLLFFIILNFSFTCSQDDILRNVYNFYNSKKSISYNVEYRNKGIFNNDTTRIYAECKIERQINDTLFRGYIWFKTIKGIEYYYDLKKLFVINNNNKIIKIFKIFNNRSYLYGNINADVVNQYFLNPQNLLNIFNDSSNTISYKSTEQNNFDTLEVIVDYPDEDKVKDVQSIFWINNLNYNIEKYNFRVKYQGDYQYSEWDLSNVKYDNVVIEDINNHIDSLTKLYQTIMVDTKAATIKELLKYGINAPLISGSIFENKINVNFQDKNQLFLLDFWYMSCAPCIQAIPHLVKLYQEYNDKGLEIFGINSNDDKNKKEEILKKFIERNKINYPIIFTDKSVDSLYNVSGYPTLYLIDKKGKIIYSTVGFAESVIDSLRVKIEEELKK